MESGGEGMVMTLARVYGGRKEESGEWGVEMYVTASGARGNVHTQLDERV